MKNHEKLTQKYIVFYYIVKFKLVCFQQIIINAKQNHFKNI